MMITTAYDDDPDENDEDEDDDDDDDEIANRAPRVDGSGVPPRCLWLHGRGHWAERIAPQRFGS